MLVRCFWGRGRIWARYQILDRANTSRACRLRSKVGRHLVLQRLRVDWSPLMVESQDSSTVLSSSGRMVTP